MDGHLHCHGEPGGTHRQQRDEVYGEASGSSKVEGRAKDAAKEIADVLKRRFQEQGGIQSGGRPAVKHGGRECPMCHADHTEGGGQMIAHRSHLPRVLRKATIPRCSIASEVMHRKNQRSDKEISR